MSDAIRFHGDENLPFAILAGLRRRGIDVTSTPETGLMGATDEEQLAFANEQWRMIITQDTDFLRLHAEGREHPGIAFYQQGGRAIGPVLAALLEIYEYFTPEDVRGQVFFL
jgi:predicted nuclease of predicted toxin-antitoxin system